MGRGRAEADRDELLAVARAVSARAAGGGIPTGDVAGLILVAWLETGLVVTDADPAFVPGLDGDVESLAFLVATDEEPVEAAAGIVLRLPGCYPDSFDPVPLPRPPLPDPAALRAAFLAPARAPTRPPAT
jgi:hypothetical protein